MSKWVTAPPRVSQEETGAAQVRASQDWLCLGHYLEERPLRGLDTVQRSRVLDMRAGNRTAWVPAYQAVNKTRWDTAVEPGAPFPFPHSPALQKQIRRKRKSVQPVFPLPSPRCCCCRRCHLPPSLSLSFSLSLTPSLPLSLSHTDSWFTFLWIYGNYFATQILAPPHLHVIQISAANAYLVTVYISIKVKHLALFPAGASVNGPRVENNNCSINGASKTYNMERVRVIPIWESPPPLSLSSPHTPCMSVRAFQGKCQSLARLWLIKFETNCVMIDLPSLAMQNIMLP